MTQNQINYPHYDGTGTLPTEPGVIKSFSTSSYYPINAGGYGTSTTNGIASYATGSFTGTGLGASIMGGHTTTGMGGPITIIPDNIPVLFIDTKLLPGKLYKSNFDFCVRNCKFIDDKEEECVNIQYEYDNFTSKDLLLFVKTTRRYLSSELYHIFMTQKGKFVGFRKPSHNSYDNIVVLEEY